MTQIFETDRLILRSTNIEDAEFVSELLNVPKWIKYIGDRNVRSLEDAKNYIICKIMPQYKKLGYGNFTVIRKLDKKKIGSCGLFDREGVTGVDIGFGFLPECEQKGYAYESAIKVKQLAKENYNLKQINAITSQHNLSSQKLLEKLGLNYLRLITLPDSTEELMLYQLTF